MKTIDEIKKLANLHSEGAITQEEFNVLKKKILSTLTNLQSSEAKEIKEENIRESVITKTETVPRRILTTKKQLIVVDPNIGNKGMVSENKNDLYAKYIIYSALGLIIISSIISGIRAGSVKNTMILLGVFGVAFFVSYKRFQQSYSQLTTAIILTIIPILFTIYVIDPNNTVYESSSTSTSSSPSSLFAKLDCPWCKKEQMSNDGTGLVYYKWEGGGVSWNQFYSDSKIECCSEKCCILYHGATKGY